MTEENLVAGVEIYKNLQFYREKLENLRSDSNNKYVVRIIVNYFQQEENSTSLEIHNDDKDLQELLYFQTENYYMKKIAKLKEQLKNL